jgi:hypothetical protein
MAYENSKKAYAYGDNGLYITPAGVIVFAALDKRFKNKKRKDDKPEDKGAYTLAIVVPPKHDMTVLREGVAGVAEDKWGKRTKGKRMPFADAEASLEWLKDDSGEEVEDLGAWIKISANTYQSAPVVRDAKGRLLEVEDIRDLSGNGAWARMIVKPAAYENESSGVTFYLDSVQLLASPTWPNYETPKSGSGGGTNGEAFMPAASDDDDEDERPAKKKPSRRDDDEDERPARKATRRRNDDDDV